MAAILTLFLASANALSDTLSYLTKPGHFPTKLHILQDSNASLLSDGYFFASPFRFPGPRNAGVPHIYNSTGELIYWGGDIPLNRSQNFHPTEYIGSDSNHSHFLFIDAAFAPDVGAGHKIKIFNSNYLQTGPDYRSINGMEPPDGHEANVPPHQNGTTLLHNAYHLLPVDLRYLNGPERGWMLSGCFQEISLTNSSLIFEWCSHNHVDPTESYVYFQGANSSLYQRPNAGNGTRKRPWDYFHFNSVTKITDGNYLVSSRHLSTIFKVAGNSHTNPGSILWRLGGKKNSFRKKFVFGMQHDARWLPDFISSSNSSSELGLSLFDNAFDNTGWTTNQYSRGMLVRLDEESMTADLKQEYPHPRGVLSGFGGSMTIRPNRNVVIGWGQLPEVSEYSADGRLLLHGQYGNGTWSSYRVFKSHWVGKPENVPAVLGYQQDCESKKHIYASWNGATEVDYFTISFGQDKYGFFDEYHRNFSKTGFETDLEVHITAFYEYFRVKAYDSRDTLLATSNTTAVFVPKEKYANDCNIQNCGYSFNYTSSNSKAEECLSQIRLQLNRVPDLSHLNQDL